MMEKQKKTRSKRTAISNRGEKKEKKTPNSDGNRGVEKEVLVWFFLFPRISLSIFIVILPDMYKKITKTLPHVIFLLLY